MALFAGGLVVVSFFCYRAWEPIFFPRWMKADSFSTTSRRRGPRLRRRTAWSAISSRCSATFQKSRATRGVPACNLGLAAVTEANTGDIAVKLKSKRSRGVDDVMDELRATDQTDRNPRVDVEFTQVLQDMIGDLSNAPEPIQIKLFSPDAALLRDWAPQVGDAIKKSMVWSTF